MSDLIETKPADSYSSDDYAGIEGGLYKFYYGYEAVDTDDNWRFVVTVRGRPVESWTAEQLGKEWGDDPQDVLCAGIARYFAEKAQMNELAFERGAAAAEAWLRDKGGLDDDDYVEDGYGGVWLRCASDNCDLHVTRPGKVQCSCDGPLKEPK